MALSSAGAASKIALLAAGATALMALSACQVDGTGTYSGGTSASSPEAAQPEAAGGQAPTKAGSGGGTGTGTPRCTAADLSVDITDQGSVAPAGTASWLLAATNTSGHSCAVNGYPSFGLQDASGTLWSDSRTTYVRHPGAPMKIVLKPGRNAFAGVKWALCGSGDLVGGLVMTPPGDTSHVKVTVNTDSDSARLKLFKVCGHTVTAGSLQPATQGVVFAS
ncbi:MAG TPA: DUF4232 domain-containing protein [Actinomadura sp.]|jgi:hypothetical protein|nr:DUF4232 domain-containing protein [Actinomadura sp.]